MHWATSACFSSTTRKCCTCSSAAFLQLAQHTMSPNIPCNVILRCHCLAAQDLSTPATHVRQYPLGTHNMLSLSPVLSCEEG